MRTKRYPDPDGFRRAASAFLLEREARNTIVLSLAGTDGAYRVVAAEDGRVAGCAFRTPPHGFGLSHATDPRAAALFARDAAEEHLDAPWLIADKPDAQAFCAAWPALSEVDERQGIYACDAVAAPDGVPGVMRPARAAERELLLNWTMGFADDVGEHLVRERLADGLDARLENGPDNGLVVWERDGEAVSMAGYNGPTPNAIRVSLVYTPPEHRGRGYAAACVAALTQRLLDGGRREVHLFTQMQNQVSNRVYRRIGYRQAGEVVRVVFGRTPG